MRIFQRRTLILFAMLTMCGACGKEDEPSSDDNKNTQILDMMQDMQDMQSPDAGDETDLGDPADTGVDAGVEPLEPNGDADGDGLTNKQETDGWMISVDRVGLGNAIAELVTSNPRKADSDDDGLDDQAEFQRTDPNKPDTDGDGLTDLEEVNVYLSIATSVDTDGDSVSGATSNAQLWDGDEINKWGTSPSLADTDGDNRTDFDEIINNATNPLVAQVPLVDVSFEGIIDIAVDVEYAEAEAQDRSYGLSVSSSQSNSQSRTNGTAVTNSVEQNTTISATVESGLPPSASVSVSRSTTTGYSNEESASISSGEGRQAQQEHNEMISNQSMFTETSATGRLSMGMVISNPSEIAYTLTNLTVSVFLWDVDSQEFKTVGTMKPNGLDELNFGPGDSTEAPIQVNAENLNVDLIREFLRNPKSLIFSVSNFDMQNSEGLNFVFLDEVTQARTGRVVVDYGDGRVDDARVATNVRRNADGSLAGVKLSTVFEDILSIPIETKSWASEIAVGELAERVGVQVLTKVRDLENTPEAGEDAGFWVVFSDIADLQGTYKDFGDAVLQRGETLYVAYMRDRDGDGVYDREEDFHQSSDEMADSDGDMLTDFEEVKVGWIAGTGLNKDGYPRQVFSTPSSPDADEDGLDDMAERMAGTDPLNADTDSDGLIDSVDPNPNSDVNEGPIISLTQSFNDPVVTLTGTIIDPVDEIDEVVIDWGDGSPQTFTSGFDAFDVSHGYLRPLFYRITVTARDVRGATTVQTFTATSTIAYAEHHYTMDNGFLIDAVGGTNGFVYADPSFNQLRSEDRFMMADSAMGFGDGFDTSNWGYGIINSLNINLSSFSVAFWVKGGSGGKVILHQPGRFIVRKDNSANICVEFGDSFTPVCSTNATDSNDWNLFVVTSSGSRLNIYTNGASDVSTALSLPGNLPSCSEIHFNGELGCGSTMPSGNDDRDTFSSFTLDDVRFFSRVTSLSDAVNLYSEGNFMP